MTKKMFKCDKCGEEWPNGRHDQPPTRRTRIFVHLLRGNDLGSEPAREVEKELDIAHSVVGSSHTNNQSLHVELCADCDRAADFVAQFKKMFRIRE